MLLELITAVFGPVAPAIIIVFVSSIVIVALLKYGSKGCGYWYDMVDRRTESRRKKEELRQLRVIGNLRIARARRRLDP